MDGNQPKGVTDLYVILGLVAIALLAGLIWCLLRDGKGSPGSTTTTYNSLPPGCPAGTHPADTTQLRACLTGLAFDTVPALGDEQRLMIYGSLPGPACRGDSTHSCRYGPLAKIEPVMGAQTYTDSALEEGRIIARMFIRAGETDSYPKLGLVLHDTTYWYVNTNTDSSSFVSRPPQGDSLAVKKQPLQREPHPGRFHQAVARWVWYENDEKGQGNCGQACCR